MNEKSRSNLPKWPLDVSAQVYEPQKNYATAQLKGKRSLKRIPTMHRTCQKQALPVGKMKLEYLRKKTRKKYYANTHCVTKIAWLYCSPIEKLKKWKKLPSDFSNNIAN